ncbi:agmatinase [Sulfurimonas aquatica]|uniref:Agmatinase n=1 Tax=Sulfurimonas aquatica TaxID=2672570 RepID=A0A975GDN3_9BACT|nr:agmatinase [Sulfurimonas aquatica]QSZ42906.1 agmatinase [Sulfurimonas aquatica]
MEYQELPNASLEDADIVILPIGYEESVCGQGGTADAPKAIVEISEQLEYYEEDLKWSPMKYMKVRVEEEIREYAQIDEKVSTYAFKEEKLLISLGGEHSITPQITASRLSSGATIIFLDAHGDLRESYQGYEFSHATPVHHLLAQGHKVIMAGIRSLFETEAARIESDEMIECFLDRELRKPGMKEKLLSLISSIEGEVYLSIDMDAFNPAYVPSVGTPQPGGLDWYFALDIIEALFENKKAVIKGVDIMELIPEASTVSQVFAAKLMQKIISYWGKSRGFDKKEMNGSQTLVKYE